MFDTKLSALVNALPEFYQPIYGHSEWDDKPLRSCKDRAIIIEKIYDDLSKELGRPLRVLDLGCAQGFFSLSLALRGGYYRNRFSRTKCSAVQFLGKRTSPYQS